LSVASENLHQRPSPSIVHSNMKQRYLEEIQAAKVKSGVAALLDGREVREEPNIFYHSISDQQQPAADERSEEEDPKLEQKLFKLAYRKKFRSKA
jgi:hypothetical protein